MKSRCVPLPITDPFKLIVIFLFFYYKSISMYFFHSSMAYNREVSNLRSIGYIGTVHMYIDCSYHNLNYLNQHTPDGMDDPSHGNIQFMEICLLNLEPCLIIFQDCG